jgi:DNA-binding CsgD family transcriptional regulator/predicted DNA-binding protein YlxM (UPF0122 family)
MRKLNELKEAELIKLYNAGATWNEMAIATDIPYGTLGRVVARLKREGKLFDQPRASRSINITTYISRLGPRLIHLYSNTDLTQMEIAAELNIARSTLQRIIKTLIQDGNLIRRKPPRKSSARKRSDLKRRHKPQTDDYAPVKCRCCSIRLDFHDHPDPKLQVPPGPDGLCYWCSVEERPSPQVRANIFAPDIPPTPLDTDTIKHRQYGQPLSMNQWQIAILTATLKNKQIAELIGNTPNSVSKQIHVAMVKLGCSKRSALADLALEHPPRLGTQQSGDPAAVLPKTIRSCQSPEQEPSCQP